MDKGLLISREIRKVQQKLFYKKKGEKSRIKQMTCEVIGGIFEEEMRLIIYCWKFANVEDTED